MIVIRYRIETLLDGKQASTEPAKILASREPSGLAGRAR
jgi:hypothetical protein